MIELTGSHIIITETRSTDLETVMSLESGNADFICPLSREEHIALMTDPGCAHLCIRAHRDAGPVGLVILCGLEDPEKPLEFRKLIVGEKGRGYGREAVQLVKYFAFEILQRHRLWLDVFRHNARAIELYESEGFVYEGELRDAIRKGENYLTLKVYSMLADEYERAAVRNE